MIGSMNELQIDILRQWLSNEHFVCDGCRGKISLPYKIEGADYHFKCYECGKSLHSSLSHIELLLTLMY